MPDAIDRLVDQEDFIREAYVKTKQAETAFLASRPTRAECRECGDTISEGRRKHVPGVQMCQFCQGEAELRRLMRA